MYPQTELTELARAKAALRQSIAGRRRGADLTGQRHVFIGIVALLDLNVGQRGERADRGRTGLASHAHTADQFSGSKKRHSAGRSGEAC